MNIVDHQKKISPEKTILEYDVAIIGGGPAGMIAAGRAAELGAKVVLIEKNSNLGKKLLISGGGRCNLTNVEPDTRKFLSAFKEAQGFLFSPFSKFSIRDTIEFFEQHGCPIKIEAENRAFPTTDNSKSVLDALVAYMREGNVEIMRGKAVVRLHTADDGTILEAVLAGAVHIKAKSFILATGGTSHPETGSTGDGWKWMETLGLNVKTDGFALVPVKTKESWTHQLQGLSYPTAKMTVFQNDEKKFSVKGKFLFTHFGVSGPMVLNASRDISDILSYGTTTLSIDLFPTMDAGTLDRKIQEIFKLNQNKKFKNSLGELVMPTLMEALIVRTKIDPEKEVNIVSREERLLVTNFLKDIRMTVTGFSDQSEAIVASGGVNMEEIDTRTMQSKKIPNLYLVGDMLDVNRPSGGYSLQLCWTTGYVAGEAAAKN
ncbi:MAG: aminoacetone oxidase family FAD-binding enzyme [Candidatus Paceibacterota bacterium]|jgi:hypothetical protein